MELSRRLTSCVRAEDTVARLGGDEFVVLREDVEEPDELESLVVRLLAALRPPATVEGGRVRLQASIGTALSAGGSEPGSLHEAERLVSEADADMYRWKQKRRGQRAARAD